MTKEELKEEILHTYAQGYDIEEGSWDDRDVVEKLLDDYANQRVIEELTLILGSIYTLSGEFRSSIALRLAQDEITERIEELKQDD